MTDPNGFAAKGRAWANVFLLGSEAKGIKGMLTGMKPDQKDQKTSHCFNRAKVKDGKP